ncbi:MAG: hypothetical protein V4503_00060 [Gemmatimonadota bacterium]
MKRLLCCVILLSGCGQSFNGPGTSVPVRALRPEDRVLLGDFSRVNALAASFDRLFVAYPTALGIYRPIERRWDVPRSPAEPRLLSLVFAAVIDGIDHSVWLALPDGWLHYRPDNDQWDRGVIPARVQSIATDDVDPARGIWFLTASGWFLQPRFGGAANPAAPPRTLRPATTVEDAMRDLPQLRALAPTLTTGPRLGAGRITAAAPSADNNGWYLGTTNRGLLFFSRLGAQAEAFQLGLPSEVVGAVAASGEVVWVATDATTESGAQLTRLSSDLSHSETLNGLITTGLPFNATRRLLITDKALWAGTDQGLVRQPLNGGSLTRFDGATGLADQRVTALTLRNGRVVAGTLRGLSEEGSTGRIDRIATKYFGAAYDLVARGDTVFAATANGLGVQTSGGDDLVIPDAFRGVAGGSGPVYGVGFVADTLVAMNADRLIWRDPRTGSWTPGPMLSGETGRLTTLLADESGVWVAGTRGAALVRPNLGPLRFLTVPGDLPDQVTSIARTRNHLWIGTPRGLVRYLLEVR